MLTYKGFVGRLGFSPENMLITGEVINARDVLVFEGKDAQSVRENFVSAIDDYLKLCDHFGEKPRADGQLVYVQIEIPEEDFLKMKERAAKASLPLETWIANQIKSIH